jgi:hypothetical protein
MIEDNENLADQVVECNVCLKEIPVSEARSVEVVDYVMHFCGIDCYSKWKEQNTKTEK